MDLHIFEDLKGIESKFYQICSTAVNSCDLSLYDFNYVKASKTLKLYIIDLKTKSANLDDCVRVDHSITPYFESEDWIPEDIVLEVSSPGIYRNLRSKQHFECALGEQVTIVVKEHSGFLVADDGEEIKIKNHQVSGILEIFDGMRLGISINKRLLYLPLDNIRKANLEGRFQ